MAEHHQKEEMPPDGQEAFQSTAKNRGREHRKLSPKVADQNCKALNSLRHAERMVDARQIASLPDDHPRRRVSLAKIGGGS